MYSFKILCRFFFFQNWNCHVIIPIKAVWHGKLLVGTAKWRSILAQSLKKWKQPEVPKRETSLSCRQNRDQKKPHYCCFFLCIFYYALGKHYTSTFSADSQARYNQTQSSKFDMRKYNEIFFPFQQLLPAIEYPHGGRNTADC